MRVRAIWLTACALLCLCGTARAEMRDPATFPQPHARCMRARTDRLLTTVSRVPGAGGTTLEVVADARLYAEPGDGVIRFGQPSISIFARGCRRIWHETFDKLGEVGFKDLRLPGGTHALYVLAISVFEPADGTISAGELLSVGSTRVTGFGPFFNGSRWSSFYIGPLPHGQGYGIVQEDGLDPGAAGQVVPTSKLYRWTAMAGHDRRHGPATHGFAPAVPLDARALQALSLPDTLQPSFPACDFTFGGDLKCGPFM